MVLVCTKTSLVYLLVFCADCWYLVYVYVGRYQENHLRVFFTSALVITILSKVTKIISKTIKVLINRSICKFLLKILQSKFSLHPPETAWYTQTKKALQWKLIKMSRKGRPLPGMKKRFPQEWVLKESTKSQVHFTEWRAPLAWLIVFWTVSLCFPIMDCFNCKKFYWRISEWLVVLSLCRSEAILLWWILCNKMSVVFISVAILFFKPRGVFTAYLHFLSSTSDCLNGFCDC